MLLLLLLYSYIIIIPVVHARLAAIATTAAADRCSFSLINPLPVVAVVGMLLVWYLLFVCVLILSLVV